MNHKVARILFAIAAIAVTACTDDSSTGDSSRSGSPDLAITSSMRSDCPDTTGIGAPKQAAFLPPVAATYEMRCQFSVYDNEGYLVHEEDETAIISDTDPFATGCAGISEWASATMADSRDDSGFYFYTMITTIMGNQSNQTRCFYLEDEPG